MSESTKSSCGWQGYGFGAPYEDAGCVNGRVSDLDDCYPGPEGPLVAVGEEECPQCAGIGKALGFTSVGAMALIRQRARAGVPEVVAGITDADLRAAVEKEFDEQFTLILKLEGGVKP